MGIIKAAINAVTGALADTWLEVIESAPMGNNDVIVPGQAVDQKGRSQNKKGGENLVSNGSIIHVLDNQFMILVDGGKIVDYTATAGYYKVDNSALPSLFNGQFGDSIKESFSRIKYGGISSTSQRVFFLNLQEIRGIKFGTQNPVQYFDNFYESELFMRLHGTYSIKITDPFKFYMEVIPREVITNNEKFTFAMPAIQQFNDEFVSELGTAFNQYSADGFRVSHIASKTKEMGKYMADALDEDWNQLEPAQRLPGYLCRYAAPGLRRRKPEDCYRAQQDGVSGQLPQGRRFSAGIHGKERRRRYQRRRQQPRRRGYRLYGYEHGSEHGRRRNGQLYAKSPVRQPTAVRSASAATAPAASAAGSPAGGSCTGRLDMRMRCNKPGQVLLRVRQG